MDENRPANCYLCGKRRNLKESHILPEFLYKDTYDDKHRAVPVGLKSKKSQPYIQKGLREFLLCAECETKFSKWETYASSVIRDRIKPASLEASGKKFLVDGIDYPRFKLFQMSLLWRAGVAKDEFFSKVRLGSHEGHLRLMLLKDNPGTPMQYGSFLGYTKEEIAAEATISMPLSYRSDGHILYRFHTGFLFWYIVVSNHSERHPLAKAFLTEDGQLHLFHDVIAPADVTRRLIDEIRHG